MKILATGRIIFLLNLLLLSISLLAQGTVDRIKLSSQALAGNLSGDDPRRDISVYLPPSYHQEISRRFPVVYMLHGFTDSESKWFGNEKHWINLPAVINQSLANQLSEEMIVVMPNAYNRFKGSMYSNSITIGDWETFIAKELVRHIDENYRTLAVHESRGLTGHSMGGYGAIRIGMKYPDVFSSIYLLSACCMEKNVNPNAGLRKNTEAVKSVEELEQQPFFVMATMATAAAWAPNPSKPPFYFDLPFKEGKDIPEIVAKFEANATLSIIDQYISNLKKLRGIAMDVGDQDWGINAATKSLHNVLEKYKIEHFYEVYEGDHTNRIAERIGSNMLPFFSERLDR